MTLTLADTLRHIVDVVEQTRPPRDQNGRYRLARSKNQLDAHRSFALQVEERIGPLDTGIEPRVEYVVSLALVLDRGEVDLFEDTQRLASEAAALARELERDRAGREAILVGETTFNQGEDGFDVALIPLTIAVQE